MKKSQALAYHIGGDISCTFGVRAGCRFGRVLVGPDGRRHAPLFGSDRI